MSAQWHRAQFEAAKGVVDAMLDGPLPTSILDHLLNNDDLKVWDLCLSSIIHFFTGGTFPRAPITVTQSTNVTTIGESARHSDDFRFVVWYGSEYSFTGTQAAVVEQLWTAWENGTPEVGDRKLIEVAGSEAERLRDLFKQAARQTHPAWGTMIVEGATQGSRRLSPPS